jgi:hypothetical protein
MVLVELLRSESEEFASQRWRSELRLSRGS